MLSRNLSDLFSVPSLFIPNFKPLLKNTEYYADEVTKRWFASKLFLLDTYLENSLDFDVLLIEATPLFRNVEGIHKIEEECKVWLHNRNVSKYQYIVEALQTTNIFMQKSRMTPFFHPIFTGILNGNNETRWGRGCCSNFSRGRYSCSNRYGSDLSAKYESWYRSYIKDIDVVKKKVEQATKFSIEHGYSYIPLGLLSVPQLVDYYRDLWDLTNQQKSSSRIPELQTSEFHSLVSSYQGQCGSLIEALLDSELEQKCRQEIMSILEKDLQFCHEVGHKDINQKFQEILGCEFRWSTFLGIPLTFQQAEAGSIKQEDVANELPKTYRGGVWIYAASLSERTSEQELCLEKIARFSWLLFMDRYTLEISENSKLRQQVDFAHQTYGLVESVVLGLRRTGTLEKLPTGIKQALFVLQETVSSYRRTLHDHSRDSKFANDLQAYADLASLGALERLRDSKTKEPRYIKKLDEFEQSDDPGKALLNFSGFQVPEVPAKWQPLISKESLGVMLYHTLWQALYHSVCWKVDNPNAVEVPAVVLNVTDEWVDVRIKNPGSNDGGKFSKDSRTLRELGGKFGATDVLGPIWQDDSQCWVTEFKFVLAEVGWRV
jgi:hypothetical protein